MKTKQISKEPIVELKEVRKVYIMGKNRPAKKAHQKIRKLARRIATLYAREQKILNKKNVCCREKRLVKIQSHRKRLEQVLNQAQKLFSNDEYYKAYKLVSGRNMRKYQDKGVVVHALNGVNLQINRGEFVAIMGPSGSGKSTLLNMIGCLDRPSRGAVWMDGVNVTEMPRRFLPKIRLEKIGFIFQSFNLIPTLTALENVVLALRYRGGLNGRKKKEAKEMLTKVGLGSRLDHRPDELSGGQKQRVAIARALINKPAIILADEPTGELDSKTSAELIKMMKDLNRKMGQTFIIVTHDPMITKSVDRVIKVKDGKIISH